MGGLVSTDTSNDTNNKSQPVTNRKQSSSLEQKINQYAADLILRSNFRDMQSLMKKEECDKLVILTSKGSFASTISGAVATTVVELVNETEVALYSVASVPINFTVQPD